MTTKEYNRILRLWDKSFPEERKAWRSLVGIRDKVGQKTLYFMILQLQAEIGKTTKSSYLLRKAKDL